MVEIVGHENKAVNEGGGCNQDVGITDDLASLPQYREDIGGPRDDLITQGEHYAAPALPLERLDLCKGILRLQTAKDLVAGNDRELKALVKAQVFLSVALCGEVPALDDFGERVGIEKRGLNRHPG